MDTESRHGTSADHYDIECPTGNDSRWTEPAVIVSPPSYCTNLRNLIGFWLLGMCNNYPYSIMLSAAHDILGADFSPSDSSNVTSTPPTATTNGSRDCNNVSTAAILLADILPALVIKAVAPFVLIPISIRILLVVGLNAASFWIVAVASVRWLTFFGICCASLSGGLGETTLLGHASHFDKNVVSTWSSGTGGAGVLAALSYAAMTSSGISPRTTIQIMLIIPVVMAISFWIILLSPLPRINQIRSDDAEPLLQIQNRVPETSLICKKLSLIKPILKYAIPLMLVYMAEYFINQGLLELIYYKGIWLSHSEQYRWLQVNYQFGVLVSRSSVNLIAIKRLWVLPILQFVNLAILLTQVIHPFLPSIWLVLGTVFFEGLLGGGAYVNTYYMMTQELSPQHKEFSMSFVPVADSFGIALAGIIALPTHDYFCYT